MPYLASFTLDRILEAGSVFTMASNTELPSGYDYQFVVQVPEDYICSICRLAMRKPVQTRCGHRFCKDCLDAALQRKPKCPLDNESLSSQQVFEDVATERQILSLKIKCPNHCDWQGELRYVQTHDEKCPLTIVPCSYVSIGCNFKAPRRSLSDHYKNNQTEHLDITTQQLMTLQDENINLKKQLLKIKASCIALMTKEDHSHYSYTWKINDFSKQLQLAKQQYRDIELYSEPFYTHKYGYKLKLQLVPNGNGAVKGTHVSVFMIIMRGEYDAILTWPFNWKHKFILFDQKPNHWMSKNIDSCYCNDDTSNSSFQRPTTDENRGYGRLNFVSHETLKTENYVVDGAVFIKFELKDPCLTSSLIHDEIMTKDEQSHYSYTWKINDFSKQLQLAKQQDRDIILYSEPFYSHKYGYKLKLQLYPNGGGDGKGTHVSVYTIIMRGEYDAILTWPFTWKYKFTLLDQKPEHSTSKNFDGGYSIPDTSNCSYQRPTTNENVGIGRGKFVSHETLKTENYVVDGEVFIKFELEDPSLTPSLCDVIMSKDDQSHYSYTWKINDFSRQLQLAKQQDRDIELYSESFYTHKYGYKLKLELDPNGFGDGKGTHVSVFMIIMRGEHDAILTWPFDWKYKFTLLDQKPDHSMCLNIDYGYGNPDTSPAEYFQRPTTDENPGYGYPKYVSHETLKTENYIVDGAVFIKFELADSYLQN